MKLEAKGGSSAEVREGWKKFGQPDSHGLVGLKPDGKVGVALPGHKFGKKEIEAKVAELLKKK